MHAATTGDRLVDIAARAPASLEPPMSAAVTPRWEWRVFANDVREKLAAANVTLDARDALRNETYIVSTRTDAGVKVRNGHLELKMLRERDGTGLELWEPVLVRAFPLPADLVGPLWQALGVPRTRPAEELRSLDELLDVVARMPSLRAVSVAKERARFELPECRGEHAVVWIEGKRVETVAVEDADPHRVLKAAGRLRIAHLPNTNYPRALKTMLGIGDADHSAKQESA